MALKRSGMGPVIFFRVAMTLSVLLMTSLVLLVFVALQAETDLKVVVQFFPTTKDSATLRNFSQLNTLSPIEWGGRKTLDEWKERDLINETLMRYYLDMRHEQIQDVREMRFRWGKGAPAPVYMLSSLDVYNEFAVDLEKKLDDLPETVITIDNVEILNRDRTDNTFNVNFDVLEHFPDGRVRGRGKNAILEFRYDPRRIRYSPNFSNPYGLVFVRYEERDRKPASS